MTWLRPDEAAVALGVTVNHVRVLAHREGWRKAGRGRQVGYWLDDVSETHRKRAAQDAERSCNVNS